MLAQALLIYHVKACDSFQRMGGKIMGSAESSIAVDASFVPLTVQ